MSTIESFHPADDEGVGIALANLAMFFDRVDRPEIASMSGRCRTLRGPSEGELSDRP